MPGTRRFVWKAEFETGLKTLAVPCGDSGGIGSEDEVGRL